jgi:5-methylcytosine-specific restriction endonuclease McrA
MSRDRNYQRLLNSKRWQEVKRIVWQRTNGLCEECMKQGIVRAGVDCHHIVPVETATTPQEMERLCFDVNNVRLLCIACHSAIHKGMGKGTRKLAIERAKQRQDRWAEGLTSRFTTAKGSIEEDR